MRLSVSPPLFWISMKTLNKILIHGVLCELLLCNAFPTLAQEKEQSAEFDISVLKNRGLSSGLATYFADAAKFLPGRKTVNLYVNGKDLGTATALFGHHGELCVDVDFLTSAGLVVPSGLTPTDKSEYDTKKSDSNQNDTSCYDYHEDYPTTVITPLPGEERLDIVVPEEALSQETFSDAHLQKGGNAGLFNYDLFSTKNSYEGGSNTYTQGSFEEGLNIQDWLFRSRQMVTKNEEKLNTNNLYSYVQHTFIDKKMLMQTGEINISNTLFSGSAITGIQLVPESALTSNSGSGVVVRGVAQGSQARVEVRQSGALVYSTLVPMGPFTLENVPITSVNTALNVSVKETDGSEHHYIIPAESLHPNQLGGPKGFSVAAGKIRDVDTRLEKPYLVTISKGWKLTPFMNVSAGGMIATKYNSVASSLDVAPFSSGLLSMTLKESDDKRGDNQGVNSILSANYTFPQNINISASASRYSSGYREITDTLQDDFAQYSSQYSTNLAWSNNTLGSFSLGYSMTKGFSDSDNNSYLSLNWGKTFSKFSVSVNWQTLLNKSDCEDDEKNSYASDDNDQQLYVNLSIPIGTQHIGAYWRKQGNSASTGLQTSGNINQQTTYSIAAERDINNQENDFSGSISDNLHYTKFGLNASMNGKNDNNYGAALSGGIVAHSQGVTFSPYKVDDTFAVVSLGEKISDVEISTPSGDVWTDHWGHAVVPSVPAFRDTRVEINTETLPKNIDVDNGISTLASNHGTVSQIHFGVVNVRRAVLNLKADEKSKMPKGSTIVDSKDNYVTTAIEDGQVFLSDIDNIDSLFVINDEGKHQCQLKFNVPKQHDLNAYYENMTGVCS